MRKVSPGRPLEFNDDDLNNMNLAVEMLWDLVVDGGGRADDGDASRVDQR